MTLPAWLERASPGTLGVFLGKTASSRKSGLFVRHLCRTFHEAFVDSRSLAALDDADRYEAGEIDEPAYRAAVAAAVEAANAAQSDRHNWQDRTAQAAAAAAQVAKQVVTRGYYPRVLADLGRIVGPSNSRHSMPRKRTAQAARLLFHEHFGDIHRPVALDPSWRTEAVVGLAAGIYAERAFDGLPILADALEEAGCCHAGILDHLRKPGPHVRGCWPVDLCLGLS